MATNVARRAYSAEQLLALRNTATDDVPFAVSTSDKFVKGEDCNAR